MGKLALITLGAIAGSVSTLLILSRISDRLGMPAKGEPAGKYDPDDYAETDWDDPCEDCGGPPESYGNTCPKSGEKCVFRPPYDICAGCEALKCDGPIIAKGGVFCEYRSSVDSEMQIDK